MSHKIIDSINALKGANDTEKTRQDESAKANQALLDAHAATAGASSTLKADIQAKGSAAVVNADGSVDAYIKDDSDQGYHVIPLIPADTSVDDGTPGAVTPPAPTPTPVPPPPPDVPPAPTVPPADSSSGSGSPSGGEPVPGMIGPQ